VEDLKHIFGGILLLRKILTYFNRLVSVQVTGVGIRDNHIMKSKRLIDIIMTKDPRGMQLKN
jgi:hypothetical protein